MRFGDMCFNIFMRRRKSQDSAPSRVYRLCGYLLMINTNESRIKSWNNSGKVKDTPHFRSVFFNSKEFVSQFSQNWEEIFGNGLWHHVLTEFAYLGKLLTFTGNDRLRNGDVIKFSFVFSLYLEKLKCLN